MGTKKMRYQFAKNPLKGTYFTILRTLSSKSDAYRDLLIEFDSNSASHKFEILQVDDVLILEKDLIGQNIDRYLIVDNCVSPGESQSIITVRGFSTSLYGVPQFESGDRLLFLARVEEVVEVVEEVKVVKEETNA